MTGVPQSKSVNDDVSFLLRDIGRSNRCGIDICGAEAQLMQAAGDPLLVRGLVLQIEDGQDREYTGARPDSAGLSGITRRPMIVETDAQAAHSWSVRCYDTEGSRLMPSLTPAVFTPSPEDSKHALDIGDTPVLRDSGDGWTLRWFWLALGIVFLLALVLASA